MIPGSFHHIISLSFPQFLLLSLSSHAHGAPSVRCSTFASFEAISSCVPSDSSLSSLSVEALAETNKEGRGKSQIGTQEEIASKEAKVEHEPKEHHEHEKKVERR